MQQSSHQQQMENYQPQVTVVMPSLNQCAYIEQAIDSVLSQKGVSVELIVMDGCSSDGTQELLTRLAEQAKGRLRWVSESDEGPAHAINKAMAMAQADVIGWLNADDYYSQGALERALSALIANPSCLMVYGHGMHTDEQGHIISRYPTSPPPVSIDAFADGCFICQPTVFIRKELLEILGGLNESIKTAFDFEWWLRLFSHYPGRAGFVDTVQAYSRLHDECITRTQRQMVIAEGMALLKQYLGAAPLEWYKTYLNDVLAKYPHDYPTEGLVEHLRQFAGSIRQYLSGEDQLLLEQVLDDDARLRLCQADACLDIYPDGWLPPVSSLRITTRTANWRQAVLTGYHPWQIESALHLSVTLPSGLQKRYTLEKPGKFTIHINLPDPIKFPSPWTVSIQSEGFFVPSESEPGSTDQRQLTCQIERVQLLTDESTLLKLKRLLGILQLPIKLAKRWLRMGENKFVGM